MLHARTPVCQAAMMTGKENMICGIMSLAVFMPTIRH